MLAYPLLRIWKTQNAPHWVVRLCFPWNEENCFMSTTITDAVVGATRATGSLRLSLSSQLSKAGAGVPGGWKLGQPENIRKGATIIVGRDSMFFRDVIVFTRNKRREIRAFTG